MIHYVTLLVALGISGIAGFFSIYGLGLIFSGAFIPVIIMGIALELGKVVAVSWLYRNFEICSLLLKSYLISAIVVLSLITSLGIFGFLARAHLEQSILIDNGAASQIELTQTKITQQKEAIADLDRQIGLINKAQESLIASKRAVTSLRLGDDQRKSRDKLNDERNKIQETINSLELQRVQQENANRKAGLDVGPIRYVATAIFGNSEQTTIDATVRWLIVIIIFVFDPLAVSLILSAQTGLKKMAQGNIIYLTNEDEPGTMRIQKSSIKEIDDEEPGKGNII